MNDLELRTMIHAALNKQAGTQYGDISTVEPLSPVTGEPVSLRVTAPDPSGAPRVHRVDVTEEEVGGRTLKFEPARDSQLCGHQLSETTWTSRASYCAELKAPGKYMCAKHNEEFELEHGPGVKFAEGNVRGLEAHEVSKADRVYASVADLSTDDTWELIARLLNSLGMRSEELHVGSQGIYARGDWLTFEESLGNWVHSRRR